MTPVTRAELESLYAFVQRGSTKSYRDMKAAIDRIIRIWRGTIAGKEGAPCIIAGDEETYTFLRVLMTHEPDQYRQIRRYPGDWHLLLHMAKALLHRYWGAGVEHMAKDLGTDDSKSAAGSNYRRAHHSLTTMYEAIWTVCLEKYSKSCPSVGDTQSETDRHADGVVEWIEARAKEHKTFFLWRRFLLHDYPAYLTFRIALRTGDFMLRLDALRRIAPIFFITGKDRYQNLVIDHLMEMARWSEEVLKVMSELFSVKLGKDACARLGLDERQEVANRFIKTLTARILSSSLEKMASRAQLREEAMLQFEREFIEQPATERDRCRELVGKRVTAVETAIVCLRKCPLFGGDAGKDRVMALDGRVVTGKSSKEILGAPDQALAKMQEVAEFRVLRDRTKKGATKKKVYSIPAANSTTKATNRKGKTSAVKDSAANALKGGGELKAFMLNIWDAVSERGSLLPEQVFEMASVIGTTTPYCMANVNGGERESYSRFML